MVRWQRRPEVATSEYKVKPGFSVASSGSPSSLRSSALTSSLILYS